MLLLNIIFLVEALFILPIFHDKHSVLFAFSIIDILHKCIQKDRFICNTCQIRESKEQGNKKY